MLQSYAKLESCFITLPSSGQTLVALHIEQFKGGISDTVLYKHNAHREMYTYDTQVGTSTSSQCHI